MTLVRFSAVAAIVCVVARMSVSDAHGLEVCDVTFSLDATEPAAIIQFRVDYSAVQGTFSVAERTERDEDGVEMTFREPKCTTLIDNVTPIARLVCVGSYDECQWGEGRTLAAIFTLDTPVSGAVPLLRCEFRASAPPEASSFVTLVEDATSPQDARYAMLGAAAVNVSGIACSSSPH